MKNKWSINYIWSMDMTLKLVFNKIKNYNYLANRDPLVNNCQNRKFVPMTQNNTKNNIFYFLNKTLKFIYPSS